MLDRMARRIGEALAAYLDRPVSAYRPFSVTPIGRLRGCLRPGDILLIEGDRRISTAIKYLTQSTWSHAAFYVGDALDPGADPADARVLVEADLKQGVIGVPIAKYRNFNTRICRPVGLTDVDRDRLVRFMIARIGMRYDLKNVVDLMRYLLPTPPVPARFRRRMLALGSGDPTRAICSSVIAQAFQSVRYPILPNVEERRAAGDPKASEILHIRHHSLFAPRDFDLSPYFEVVKPTLAAGFDYRDLAWYEDNPDEVRADSLAGQSS